MKKFTLLFLFLSISISAQTDSKTHNIINAVSADRIKADIKTLTKFTLERIVIGHFFFGIAAAGKDGYESVVVFPNKIWR